VITRPAAFRVYGEPAPKGSLAGRCLTHPRIGQVCVKAARVAISEDANRGRSWRRKIEKGAPVHLPERADRHQPVALTLLFAVTRRPAAEGRRFPATRSAQGVGGDLDKMVRLVLDALESCKVLADDAQVVELAARKVFTDDPAWWHGSATRRNGMEYRKTAPGLYCRIEPVGYLPPELPYEATLSGHDERH
jgi:Holliday junction resolvase RusA-like endonuclease